MWNKVGSIVYEAFMRLVYEAFKYVRQLWSATQILQTLSLLPNEIENCVLITGSLGST
jgi:hypothetical protein